VNNELKLRMEQAGVDVSSGVERFMGNEALFERFLRRFIDDKSYIELAEAISAGDAERAFMAAHTLKGVCGNLSMVRLENLVRSQVEYLRSGDFLSASKLMPDITAAYEIIISVIRE
jgi:HPt (histidine-containing phosphotransfer) domain-containing protein